MAASMSSASLSSFVIGRDDGIVLPYDPSTTVVEYSNAQENHTGPILSLDYHPLAQGSYSKLSNLLLSASADWTVKLWSVNGLLNNTMNKNVESNDNNNDNIDSNGEMNDGEGENEKANEDSPLLYTFGCNDYVFDAKWSPVHPGTFAVADGCGAISLWDITERLDAPIISCQCDNRAQEDVDAPAVSATSLKWNHSGSKIAVGDSLGRVHVFGVGEHWQMATAESWAQTNERVKLMSKGIN